MFEHDQEVGARWGRLSPAAIAVQVGCSEATVYSIAKRLNLPRRARQSNHQWTPLEDDLLRNHFTTDSGGDLLALFPGLSYDQIRSRAKRLDLISRRTKLCRLVRHDYFDMVSEETCYWAGFLAADGCIHAERNQIGVYLSSRDRDHLAKLSIAASGEDRVKVFKETHFPCARVVWTVVSPRMIDRLSAIWNITPRKTATLQPPSLHALSHNLAYIGGYLDGDGFIGTYDVGGRRFIRAGAIGTQAICDWSAGILNGLLFNLGRKPTVGCKPLHSKKYKIPLYEWRCHGRNAQILLQTIRPLIAPWCLTRKWSVYEQFVSEKTWERDKTASSE
jgi:hypothetical protein